MGPPPPPPYSLDNPPVCTGTFVNTGGGWFYSMVLKLLKFNSINAIFMLKNCVSQKFKISFENFKFFSDIFMNSMKKENHTKQTKLIKKLILRFVWT